MTHLDNLVTDGVKVELHVILLVEGAVVTGLAEPEERVWWSAAMRCGMSRAHDRGCGMPQPEGLD
jgi:hypothetical protein